MVTDYAPESLVGEFINEGNVESFYVDPSSKGVVKGDWVYGTTTTALSGSQTGYVDQCPTGTLPLGVALESGAASARIPVLIHGITKMVAYGTIAMQDLVGAELATAGERAVTATTYAGGRALHAASSGDSIYVLVVGVTK